MQRMPPISGNSLTKHNRVDLQPGALVSEATGSNGPDPVAAFKVRSGREEASLSSTLLRGDNVLPIKIGFPLKLSPVKTQSTIIFNY